MPNQQPYPKPSFMPQDPAPAPLAAVGLPPADPAPAGLPLGVRLTQPDEISSTLKRQVDDLLRTIPDGHKGVMAQVNVSTAKGVNVVVAYRTENQWQAALWVGKSGWDQAAGLSLQKVW